MIRYWIPKYYPIKQGEMKKSGNGSQFAYGIDGQSYTNIGEPFQVHEVDGLALKLAFLQFLQKIPA